LTWASVAFSRVGDAAGALDAAEQAVALAPDGFFMLRQLVEALMGVRREDEAYQVCARVLKLRPDDTVTQRLYDFLRSNHERGN